MAELCRCVMITGITVQCCAGELRRDRLVGHFGHSENSTLLLLSIIEKRANIGPSHGYTHQLLTSNG